MEGIKIPIGAPLGQLDSDLKGAQSKLKAFATSAASTAGTLGGSVAKGANQAGFALQNLGRVAQDAPFGFIGIQNNLNPLLESFQRLKAETGSTSSALKALGGSLLGPGGLGIAFSVISAAVLFYQQYQQKANRETKVAVDTYKELSDSIKTYAAVQAQGRENASKDLSQLQSLYKATQNVNIPQTERLKIAKELIKEYPTYLKGFSAEEVIAGKATIAYQKLTQAILAKGLAQAGEANRQKLINKQLEDEVRLAKAQEALKASTAKAGGKGQALPGLAASFEPLQLADAVQRDTKAVTDLKNGIAATAKEITLLDDVTQKLIQTFGADVVIDPEKINQSNKSLKSQSDILSALSTDFKQISADVSITFGKANQEKVGAIGKAIKELIGIGVGADSSIIKKLQADLLAINPAEIESKAKMIGVSVGTGLQAGLQTVQPILAEQFELLNKQFIDWNRNISDIINNGLVQTLGGIGEAIGQSLANGSSIAQNLGASLLASLGSVLGQLGQMAIATGVALLGIQTALKTLNPFAAIAAGVALLALSGIVRGGASRLSGGFSGGGGGGGYSASSPSGGVSPVSSSGGMGGGFGGSELVARVSGADLLLVINRAQAKNRRFGP